LIEKFATEGSEAEIRESEYQAVVIRKTGYQEKAGYAGNFGVDGD
jgi:hypothetical protein